MRIILALIGTCLQLLALAFHLYTVYIALPHGYVAASLTLFFPFLAEIYWLIKLWGIDNTYRTVFFVIVIGGIITSFFNPDER